MSGVDLEGRSIRKGAVEAIAGWSRTRALGSQAAGRAGGEVAQTGGTPLAVSENGRALGIVQLKDIVKEGLAERFEHLRRMGIRTVMITGDNPLTAGAIAFEAGVDDFLAEAKPEDKMELIRREQAGGNSSP